MEKSIIYKSSRKSIKNNPKIYQEWKGNNKFFCNGKIYAGSEYYYGLLTSLYLLINYFIYIFFIVKVSLKSFFNTRDLIII